jgi:hypothetical protein
MITPCCDDRHPARGISRRHENQHPALYPRILPLSAKVPVMPQGGILTKTD